MSEELSTEQEAVQEAENLMSCLTGSRNLPTAGLRNILDRLDTLLIQEDLLNMVRLQPSDSTDTGYGGAGHRNFLRNYYLWRRIRSHGNGVIKELRDAVKETFGDTEDTPVAFEPAVRGMRTDYAPVRELYLTFPEQVVGEGWNYTSLSGFYVNLLKLIPAEIEVILFVKNRQIANKLRTDPPRARIRYVVHSELESIWLRDYAGFNMGTHLVKPVFSPRRIGDNMKLLHSLLGVDLVPLGLVWDGGNLVTNGHYGFISSRLLKHNFRQKPGTNKIQEPEDTPRNLAEQLIRSELGISPVWVELPKADKLAHTDGYLTFISPEKALVSTFPAEWALKYPEDQKCVDVLAQQVQALGIKVERIMDQPIDKPGISPVDSAEGLYVNLLQLNGTWLVPTYDLPGEREILSQLQRLNPSGSIVPVNCTELARLGGVLHCISFCN